MKPGWADQFAEAVNRAVLASPEVRQLAEAAEEQGFDITTELTVTVHKAPTPTVKVLEELYSLADTREDHP